MNVPRQLRVPRQDGSILAFPPLDQVDQLLAANRQRADQQTLGLLGRSLSELRDEARRAVVMAACAYLCEAGEPVPALGNSTSLLMSGHQPELFHPGVWVKNFALSGLAHAHRAVAINLIVDSDTLKHTSVAVPSVAASPSAADYPDLDPNHYQAVKIPFDRWGTEVPYEERQVLDDALFTSFADRAGAAMAVWKLRTLLPGFWNDAPRERRRTGLIGECFAAARRSLERRWGCHNLEVPVSRVANTLPFAWFACHLLSDLPRFHAIHNDAVREYRKAHGIRSRNHPVPDLATDSDWLEAPFWAWRTGSSQRGRLMVRERSGVLELRVGGQTWPTIPAPVRQGNTDAAVAAWADLEGQGFKVRSRALITTLFARVFLSDLFVHGIGGARYDELTDTIVHRFYKLEPPDFLVLSGTRLLPLPAYPVEQDDVSRLAYQLRDLYYNPQRHLQDDGLANRTVQELTGAKRTWIVREPVVPEARRERFQALRRITDQLRPLVHDQLQRTEHDLERGKHQVQANAILLRRDYAFCLYPEEVIRPFCTQFLATR